MNAVSPPPEAWYRQRWPWILMAGPAAVVVASLFTAWLAWRGSDQVVADDYYKQGLAVNREIARTERATALKLAGELSYEGIGVGDRVRVRLAGVAPADTALRVRLVHPARGEDDRVAMLARRGPVEGDAIEYVGEWQAAQPLASAVAVRWHVVVESRDWRLDAELLAADAPAHAPAPVASPAVPVHVRLAAPAAAG